MPLTEQLEELVDKLQVRTSDGSVSWEQTADDETFIASVGKFVVTLGKDDMSHPPTFTIRVSDPSNKTLEAGEYTGYGRLANLHELARRRALQVDAQLKELLSSLD